MTATFMKMSLYFYTGIFLEFCLNFSLLKTVYEDKPGHIAFVCFFLVVSITIGRIKSTSSIFSGW